MKTGGVGVTTYETTRTLNPDDSFHYSLLIVDEAHYIKNPDANRTINVRKIAKKADRLLFMTGTAIENNVYEMINLIRMLQPDVADQIEGLEYLSAAPVFRQRVIPVYYRRKRDDVMSELPELIESKEWCTLTPMEREIYEDAVLNRKYAEARRVSWNVDNVRQSSKAKRMLEIIEDAKEDNRKVLVFSFFLDTINKVSTLLGKQCLEPINGSVPPARRQEIIDEFEQAPAGSVLVAQIQSGGTGLNIQAANVVIICEPQFKPSIENQAISRAYRIKQQRDVLVYRLLANDTIDERITDLLAEKQDIFNAFADQSEAAKETIELDNKTFNKIIEEEIEKINANKNMAA